MNRDINDMVVEDIKRLYAGDADARAFLDRAASRQRDASATSIDRIMTACELTRADAVRLAKRFEEIGCAEFIVGRRGALSRVEWRFSLISLGKIASGETTELESVGGDAEPDENTPDTKEFEQAAGSLSLREAKEGLARSLGVPVANIEITVKA